MLGDSGIVSRGPGIDFDREFAAQFQGGLAVRFHLGRHLIIVGRIHHHGDAAMILGGAAQHGWATDVDVFDRVFQSHIRFGDGLLKGVQIHDHKIDGGDVMFLDRGFMFRVASNI